MISLTDGGIIVLYMDGTCESAEYAIENNKEKNPRASINVIPTGFEILKPATFQDVNDNILLTYFIKSTTTDETQLIYFKLEKDTLRSDGSIRRAKLVREENGVGLCGFTVVNSSSQLQLITICMFGHNSSQEIITRSSLILGSDRRMFMMPMRFNVESSDYTPGYFISVLEAVKVDQPLSISGVGRDCISIYGANASPQEGGILILYNTQFKVIESKQPFKVYFNKSRLWVVDTHVFLAVGQKLAVVSFRTSNERLADMLGSQRAMHLTSLVDTECINEEAELEENIEFKKNAQIHINGTDNDNEYSDRNTAIQFGIERINAYEGVEKVIPNLQPIYSNNIIVELNHDHELLSDRINLKLLSNPNNEQLKNRSIRAIAAELERLGESEIAISNLIIPVCIQMDSAIDLINSLRAFSNLSERMIVLSLKYFIEKIKMENESALELNDVQEYQLYTILSCSFETESIIDQLRIYLRFEDALFLLNFVFLSLECNETQFARHPNNNKQIDESHLINWISAIVDSHFHQFFLSRNVQLISKLEHWKTLVESLLTDLQLTKTLSAIFDDLVNGKRIAKENIASKWYSVEEIQLY